MQEIKQKLKEIIINDLKLPGVKLEDIKDDSILFGGELGLDSLDAVELVVLVKKYFGVQIKDMDEGKEALRTINSLADFIHARMKGETGEQIDA